LASDGQTNGQTDGQARCVKPLLCREQRRINNPVTTCSDQILWPWFRRGPASH